MKTESFVFYRSFYEAVKKIPQGEREELYEAIFEYALNGDVYTGGNGVAAMVLEFVRPQIDANIQRRMNGIKGAEAGKKGGRPRKPQENPKQTPNKPQENPKQTPNVNVNDNVECLNDNDNVDKEKDNTSIIPKEKKERTPDFDFKGALIEYGTSIPLADEWIRIRSAKNNINTKIAFDYILSEANKIGITIPEVVEFCVSKQYIRFEASWYVNAMREQRNNRGGGFMSDAEAQAICDAGLKLHEFIGRNRQ